MIQDSATLAGYLKQRGRKLTRSRLAVLRQVSRYQGPFSPGDIHTRIQNEDGTVGLTTVYRTLDILYDLGLIQRAHLEDGCHSYIAVGPTHVHQLICSSCGIIQEVPECELEDFTRILAEHTGFDIRGHWLEFYGRCQSCRAAVN
ncbi:MAG: ferric uptake regulator, Fur family [Dehalococcoidia bacterium]|nr:ferric uptake regulator, Fur family [Dehalococcoidia bacterium]